MEGIDLAGVVDSDFQGIQINFAPPRPAGFANFRGAGRGGAGQPFFRGAGLGGAHIPVLFANWRSFIYQLSFPNYFHGNLQCSDLTNTRSVEGTKLRLPLGPPISSLSQRPMEHKVIHTLTSSLYKR